MDEQQIIELLTKFGKHLIDMPEEKVKLKAEDFWFKQKCEEDNFAYLQPTP